jgi:hypothetical protein
MRRVPAVAAKSLNAAAELREVEPKGRPVLLPPLLRLFKKDYFSSFVGSSDSPISADKQSIWLSV